MSLVLCADQFETHTSLPYPHQLTSAPPPPKKKKTKKNLPPPWLRVKCLGYARVWWGCVSFKFISTLWSRCQCGMLTIDGCMYYVGIRFSVPIHRQLFLWSPSPVQVRSGDSVGTYMCKSSCRVELRTTALEQHVPSCWISYYCTKILCRYYRWASTIIVSWTKVVLTKTSKRLGQNRYCKSLTGRITPLTAVLTT